MLCFTRCAAAFGLLVCFCVVPVLKAADSVPTTSNLLPGLVPAPRPFPGVGRWQLAHKIPRGRIASIAWSPDGKKIAYTEAMYVRICDAQTFKTERFLVGHDFFVTSIDWNWATNRLASAGCDGTVRIWTEDGIPEKVLKSQSPGVNAVAWRKDGARLAAACKNGAIEIWSPDGSLQKRIPAAETAINCVAWSPNGSHLISGDDRYQVKVWNVNGKLEHLCEGHLASVTAVDWSDDGKRFASAAFGFQPEENGEHLSELRLWNADGSFIGTFSTNDPICGIQWKPREQAVVCISGAGQLNVIGVDAKAISTQRISFVSTRISVPPMSFSPDGKEIAIGGGGSIGVVDSQNFGTVRQSPNSPNSNRRAYPVVAIDADRSHVILPLPPPAVGMKYRSLVTGSEADAPENLNRLSLNNRGFNRTGDRYVLVENGTKLSLWDLAKKSVSVVTKSPASIIACAYSPLDDRIAYCDGEGTIRVVKPDGTKVAELPAKKPWTNPPRNVDLRWSEDGRAIILGQATQPSGHLEVRRFDGAAETDFEFAAPFNDYWVSSDLRRAAAATGTIEISKVQFCLDHGQGSQDVPGWPSDVDSFDCSPDGTQIVLGRDSGDWQLRRLATPSTPVHETPGHTGGSCMAAVFSPDAKRVATGGWDALVKIWKPDGAWEKTLYGSTHPIYKVWWSRDGKHLVSSSRNATICRWRVDDGKLESLTLLNEEGNLIFIPRDGQIPLSNSDDAAVELVALIENLNGSTQIVDYPEFLKRTGQSEP